MYRWEEGKAAPANAASMDSMDESGACRLVINSHFDSGNIEVTMPSCLESQQCTFAISVMTMHSSELPRCHELQVADASDPQNIQLRIHEDPFCKTDGQAHFQYDFKPLP